MDVEVGGEIEVVGVGGCEERGIEVEEEGKG